ncbi:hypothetical protein ACKWTF_015528 [Chironomus riparius]
MNKVIIIALIAIFCIFDITESSKRVVRQYGYPQNFYPTGNFFGSRSSVPQNLYQSGNAFGSRSSIPGNQGGQFGPNQPFNPAFPNFPNWNQPLPFGGFQTGSSQSSNAFASRSNFGGSDGNVKKSSTTCTYVSDGKKTEEKCESTNS